MAIENQTKNSKKQQHCCQIYKGPEACHVTKFSNYVDIIVTFCATWDQT